MDHEEDQLMELEALEAIFAEDYELQSSSPERVVRLRLQPVPGDEGDEESLVVIDATFRLPAAYPDVAPAMTVEPVRGLTAKHCAPLLELASASAEVSLGMPLIFSVAEALKEWLVENNKDHTDNSMHAQMLAKQEAQEKEKTREEEEAAAKEAGSDAHDDGDGNGNPSVDPEEAAAARRRLEGTPVTMESFKKWEDAFVREMHDKMKKDDPKKALAAARSAANAGLDVALLMKLEDGDLTGRQYFELQTYKKSIGAIGAAGGAAEAGAAADEDEDWEKDIQEDLFLAGDDDSDLDDLDDDDDDDDE